MNEIDMGIDQNYRKSDPDSSKAAGENLEKSGEGTRQRELVLGWLAKHRWKTARGLAEAVAGPEDDVSELYHMIARRLPELLRVNLVCRDESKKPCTWAPIAQKPGLALLAQAEIYEQSIKDYPIGNAERVKYERKIADLRRCAGYENWP